MYDLKWPVDLQTFLWWECYSLIRLIRRSKIIISEPHYNLFNICTCCYCIIWSRESVWIFFSNHNIWTCWMHIKFLRSTNMSLQHSEAQSLCNWSVHGRVILRQTSEFNLNVIIWISLHRVFQSFTSQCEFSSLFFVLDFWNMLYRLFADSDVILNIDISQWSCSYSHFVV